jgi:hypothetical protein
METELDNRFDHLDVRFFIFLQNFPNFDFFYFSWLFFLFSQFS